MNKIIYWDLKNHVFISKGLAQHKYQIIKVELSECTLKRLKDNQIFHMETQKLLRMLNETN